jgi:hypothetical protein
VRSYLSLLLILLFAGCALENAQPDTHKELVIAQNFMNAAQKQIFQKIAKRKHLKLTILDLSAGAIRKAIQSNPWDPGFDLIFIDGLSEQRHLKKLQFAHHEPYFASIPIGISYVPDSVVKVRAFEDLSQLYLWAAADKKAEPILKAHLAYAYRKRDENSAMQQSYRQLLQGYKDYELALETDFERKKTLYLCRYDTHLQHLKPVFKNRQFTYARKANQAFFADYLCLAIVQQSSQHALAMNFVRLLQQKRDQNKAFQKAFGIVAQRNTKNVCKPKVLQDYLEK